MEAMTLEQIKDWHLKRAGLESSEKTAGMHARMAKALSAHLAQRAQAVDYTGRSAKDYAIEHAGYMARGATGLIDAINALELARQQFEEGDGSEDATNAAEQSLGDAMSALRNLIYEFEKRRDRALSVQKAGPVGDGWQPIETAPKDKRILCCWLGAPGYAEVDVAINCTEKARGKVLGWCSPHDCDDRYCAPDYWMPVPEPPTSSTPGNEVDG